MLAGSLFAGIGGFDLAFSRCGIRTAWAAENDVKCNDIVACRTGLLIAADHLSGFVWESDMARAGNLMGDGGKPLCVAPE